MIQLLKNKRNEKKKKKDILTTNILVFHKTKRKEGSIYQNNTVHTHFKELSLSSVIIMDVKTRKGKKFVTNSSLF